MAPGGSGTGGSAMKYVDPGLGVSSGMTYMGADGVLYNRLTGEPVAQSQWQPPPTPVTNELPGPKPVGMSDPFTPPPNPVSGIPGLGNGPPPPLTVTGPDGVVRDRVTGQPITPGMTPGNNNIIPGPGEQYQTPSHNFQIDAEASFVPPPRYLHPAPGVPGNQWGDPFKRQTGHSMPRPPMPGDARLPPPGGGGIDPMMTMGPEFNPNIPKATPPNPLDRPPGTGIPQGPPGGGPPPGGNPIDRPLNPFGPNPLDRPPGGIPQGPTDPNFNPTNPLDRPPNPLGPPADPKTGWAYGPPEIPTWLYGPTIGYMGGPQRPEGIPQSWGWFPGTNTWGPQPGS